MSSGLIAGRPRVAVLADDLIWATRLRSIVKAAGSDVEVVAGLDAFAALMADVQAAIVDLSLRRADPDEAIAAAARAGVDVMAIGPHEDVAARRRALAAGASRVVPYRRLATDGPAAVAAWLGLLPVLRPVPAPEVAP